MTLLDFLKKKHQHKVKENEILELLHSFKSSYHSQWENPFVKLSELADHKKDLPQEKNIFNELDRTAEKIKRFQKIITFNKIKKLKKWDEKTIIQKLREISRIK